MRTVTERDLRMPEFADADPKDLEFRADGKLVRKDRGETGIRKIHSRLGMSCRHDFEIENVVIAVTSLVARCQLMDDAIGDVLWDEMRAEPAKPAAQTDINYALTSAEFVYRGTALADPSQVINYIKAVLASQTEKENHDSTS